MKAEEHSYNASRELIYHHLQMYAKKQDLIGARRVLSAMICDGLESISVLGDHCIRLFASCGSLLEANYVFDSINRPTVFTWNSMILAYINHGEEKRALELYVRMQEVGPKSDKVTFLGALKACGSTHSHYHGRVVHDQIILNGFETDQSMGNTVIGMYAKCGNVFEAYNVFLRLLERDVVSWTVVIAAFAQSTCCCFALQLYIQMLQERIQPNTLTFMATLKACSSSQNMEYGKILHHQIIESFCTIHEDLGSTIVDMYSKCANLSEAKKVFNDLPSRDVVSWGALISGYGQHGDGFTAIRLYESMLKMGFKPDKFIYTSILKACASVKATKVGAVIYQEVFEHGLHLDPVVGTALVDMHAQCGNLATAQKVFDEIQNVNQLSWIALIKGYVQQGHNLSALQAYERMEHKGIQPSQVVYVFVLKACCGIRGIIQGKLIHDHIIRSALETEVVLGSCVIDMYAQCGYLDDAFTMFYKLQDRDNMSWGALCEGCLQHEQGNRVLGLFEQMRLGGVGVDVHIYAYVVRACESIYDLRLTHDVMITNKLEENVILCNALIEKYASCGNMEEANEVFQSLQNKDVASWTALIGGYASNGQHNPAFDLFNRMLLSGVQPNAVTYLCLLKACGRAKSIVKGRQAHDEMIRTELLHDVVSGNALIDMYSKCGHLQEAQKILDSLSIKDEVSWGTMIAAYAQHGHDVRALELFGRMQEEGLKQTKVLFLLVIKACGNLGVGEQSRLVHDLVLRAGYDRDEIIGSILVDMYARCGCPAEGYKVVHHLQRRDVMLWGGLIEGFAQFESTDLAERALSDMQLQGLDPNDFIISSMITACTHAGLLEDGRRHFTSTGNRLNLLHHGCMVNLLGRTGHLKEAYDFFQTMPMLPDLVVWRSVLNGCRFYEDGELGEHCFDVATQKACFDDCDLTATIDDSGDLLRSDDVKLSGHGSVHNPESLMVEVDNGKDSLLELGCSPQDPVTNKKSAVLNEARIVNDVTYQQFIIIQHEHTLDCIRT